MHYAVNTDMCWVSAREKALTSIRRAADMASIIQSEMIPVNVDEYIFRTCLTETTLLPILQIECCVETIILVCSSTTLFRIANYVIDSN